MYTPSIVLLHAISDPAYRRRSLTQLNRGEGRQRRARVVFHGPRGAVRQRYREGQEAQLGALGLVVNRSVLWNTIYRDRPRTHLRTDGAPIQDADSARRSPFGNAHLNVLGRERCTRAEPVLRGAWRPFRPPDQDD